MPSRAGTSSPRPRSTTIQATQAGTGRQSPLPLPPHDPRRRRPAASPAAVSGDSLAQSSAGRAHYSLPPPLPSMNPNYPPHHSPYIPAQHYPHHHIPTHVPTNGGPIPGIYPYGLPHAPPYAYPPYPQYTPLAGPGGFPPPRLPDPPPQPPSNPEQSPTQSKTSTKRKRKSDVGNKSEDDHDPSAEHKKRTKTQRACDSCRSRKIRCDVLPESEPPLCQHCKQYGFECTFFLPITETRFKKKRLEEEAAAVAAAADRHQTDSDDLARRTTPKSDPLAKADTRVIGPTSAAFLLHSTANVPSRAYESYDLRYRHTWEITKTGDGFIQITQPPPPEPGTAVPKPADFRIERDVVERLVNSYFNDLAPIFTIVSREEFLSSPSPPPVLLYAICSVTAANRDVPSAVFDDMRTAVTSAIKSDDVLSTASTVNLQALLILGMCGDSHSQYMPNAVSALWLRLGTAIRMAQDLGLHRAESVKQNLDLRRRLWAACVISDRWCSLAYGHPFMIDVEDCDVRLTSSDAIEDIYMNELLKLSILLGRILKMIYSPSGLVLATDQGLERLLADLDEWKANLPPSLQYAGATESSQHAGLLRMFYACSCMLFWRVFMRISYTVPAHLKFTLSTERWLALVQLSRQAIEWLDANERMYDVWLMVAYCATSCAIVQYHSWARNKDAEAAATLRKLRDCIKRWEATLQPEHRSTRRKTAEIIALLYESTQSTVPSTAEPLNPTVGVRPRGSGGSVPGSLRGMMAKKDQSQSDGGAFAAAERPAREYDDLPKGGVVFQGEKGGSGATTQGELVFEGALQMEGQGQAQKSMMKYATAFQSQSTGEEVPEATRLLNVNPTLNTPQGMMAAQQPHVQVMNVMDEPQAHAATGLEQFAVTDNILLDGLPGSMFDWDQWNTFFARFSLAPEGMSVGGMAGSGVAGTGGEGQREGRVGTRDAASQVTA